MAGSMAGRRPTLPPGGGWADERRAMAVALGEMDRCAETLRRLAPMDGLEPADTDGDNSVWKE